jgi:conjugative relaxase-like TrwC/TraI family protein
VLTLSKVVVEMGNRADAARAGDYRLELAAAPEAFARSDYQLAEQNLDRRAERSSSLWLGSDAALAHFGLRRGEGIDRDQLISVLQGQHAQTGEQIRRPGSLKREARDEDGKAVLDDDGRPVVERVTGVAHVEMTLSVPKSVSVLWAMADQEDRRTIEDAIIAAAERTVQYMAKTKAVVHRRGEDGVRIREPAAGAAVASSLHVTARRARGDRAPAPQLHVHNLVAGVIRDDGQLVAAGSWEWFRHDAALEGGALFRGQVADALVLAGWAVRSGTGDRGRYFEVSGVPEALCEVMSPRSREVAEARAELERELGVKLHGGALAVLAKETRQAKDHDLDPDRLRDVWDALGQKHDFGPGAGTRLRHATTQATGSAEADDGADETRDPDDDSGNGAADESALEQLAADARDVVLAQLREQGPTVTLARGRALVYEAAAGRISPDQAAQLLARMSETGELIALEGGRVTSREIRDAERHVMTIAAAAAGRAPDEALIVGKSDRDAGVRAAEIALGDGMQLDAEQRDALELLLSPAGWACLTGRAGTGKGPVLHAAAEAYQAAGWRVIACAMDGTTARRMAEQLGGNAPAMTVEQLKARRASCSVQLDERTAIFLDEASKLDTDHWTELADIVERHGATVRAIGHDGQHDAIRLPGLFSEMLTDPRIPTAELRAIRRHRNPDNPAETHPWLRDYQIAVDQGRGSDAVAILQEQDAIHVHDTRAWAMGAIVEEWDRWRYDYRPGETAMIVHGPNSDVDLVNELAQQRRHDTGELGEQAVQAVDRDYLIHPGDVVAIRNAAYTFTATTGQPRPKRVENGQTAIVDAVDPDHDTLTLLIHEPGAQPRLVKIDQARLRAQHAAGRRAAAVRLNYAMHTFPAQGATLKATTTLAGHETQAKQATYVGDTRAVFHHTVHVAREDLGTHGTDEDRLARYAQRISENRQRRASIHANPDPTLQIPATLPDQQPIPSPTTSTTPDANDSASPASPHVAGSPPTSSRRNETTREHKHAEALGELHRHNRSAPVPELADRIARERAQRQQQGLNVIRGPGATTPSSPPAATPSQDRLNRERWQREALRRGDLRPQPPAATATPAAAPQLPAPAPPTTPRPASTPSPSPRRNTTPPVSR